MPTAAKLIAAIAFAALAFLAAETVKPHLEEGTQAGMFAPLSAAVGALCGWFVMGGLVGRGYRSAAGSGVRTSATLVFWVLLLVSLNEMLRLSMRRRYDGPMDALTSAFGIAVDFGRMLLVPEVAIVLIAGGLAAGALAEWGARRWP